MAALICALLTFLGTAATGTASVVASARPAAATFCVFDCSAGVRPTWPGRCLRPTQVYSTGGTSWLTLKTRYDEGTPMPERLPGEIALTSGEAVTWEGWFRVVAPNSSRTSLMGTSGSNHDTEKFVLDGVDATRRRHGAVWIDPSGHLSLTTNTGQSTGYINGPVVNDARWHHVAAVFQNRVGGVQLRLRFKVLNCDILRLTENVPLHLDVINIIKTEMAAIAKLNTEDIFVTTWDDSLRIVGGYTRFGVNASLNSPVESDVSDTILRLASRVPLAEALGAGIRDRIMQLPNNAYPIKPFGPDQIIEVSAVTAPDVTTVGSADLYVDGIQQPGKITFEPGEDNVGQDGQFVVGGGYKSRPLDAEVMHVRLWSRALTQAELVTVSNCGMPSAEMLFGGAFPHDLHADYILDGNLSNSVATDIGNLSDSVETEQESASPFVRGGICGYESCPEASPEGCPLVKNRQLTFNSTAACDEFARFNFCRRAGDTRGRPPLPYFDGCHQGGGSDIAEITL